MNIPNEVPQTKRVRQNPVDATPKDDVAPDISPESGDPQDGADIATDGKKKVVVVNVADFAKLLSGEMSIEDMKPPEGPVADAFAKLADAKMTATPDEVRHCIKNFDNNREALVLFAENPDVVYSLKSEKDVQTLLGCKSDPKSLPAEQQAVLRNLQSLEDVGACLQFSRSTRVLGVVHKAHWLSTDAAGATMLLSRGEPVTVLDRYGAPSTLKSAAEVQSKAAEKPGAQPAKEEAVKSILSLEKKGFSISPNSEMPEDIQMTDFKKMIKHQFDETLHEMFSKDPRYNPLMQRQTAIDDVAGTGYVMVRPPGASDEADDVDDEDETEPTEEPKTEPKADARPAEAKADAKATEVKADAKAKKPEPPLDPMALLAARPLNRAQIKALAAISDGNLSAGQKQFFDDMKTLVDSKKGDLMSRGTVGMDRGALHRANALASYLNMLDGGETVVLFPDGTLQRIDSPKELHELATTGKVVHVGDKPVDQNAPKTNLLMMYFDAPFDPHQKGGIYEDLPLRASKVGSNDQLDLVTLRSDMPSKKNLRDEYLQKDDMQLIKALDPKTLMNDPKTLENFVYESMKAHPDDKHFRLMVAGHGGAELGLMPDGDENNASAHGAMSCDDFADAVHHAVSRFNQETGKDRKIDNLIVGACLMGNTSFIHALAKRGDIKVLSASPEVLMGDDPSTAFQYLADPRTADKSAEEFAKDMVDLTQGASAFPGGTKNMQFSDTYGAYDLDPAKGKKLEASFDSFFKAALAEPKFAAYIKEDIAQCPTYGVNRILNMTMGVCQRDAIQIAERVIGDHRIKSDAIKSAAKELVKANEAVVLKQQMDEHYKTRRGPTVYMPVEGFEIDERMMKTSLLKGTSFADFVKMLAAQPLNRTLMESLSYEVSKVTKGERKKKTSTPAPAHAGATPSAPAAGSAAKKDDASVKVASTAATKAGDKPAAAASTAVGDVDVDEDAPLTEDEKKAFMAAMQDQDDAVDSAVADMKLNKQAESLQPLEIKTLAWYKKLYKYAIATPIITAATLAGGAAGAALGFVILTPVGALLGLHSGLSGHSVAQTTREPEGEEAAAPAASAPSSPAPNGSAATSAAAPGKNGATTPAGGSPAPKSKDKDPMDGLLGTLGKSVEHVAIQAALFPMETGGELVHRNVSYKHGNVAGTVAGATVGTASGAVGGAVTGAVVGGLAGALAGKGLATWIFGVK